MRLVRMTLKILILLAAQPALAADSASPFYRAPASATSKPKTATQTPPAAAPPSQKVSNMSKDFSERDEMLLLEVKLRR